MSEITFENNPVTLDLKPGTLYRLAKAGYAFPDSFGNSDTALLAAIELLRICSKTALTSEQVADKLEDIGPLTVAVANLFDEEEERMKSLPQEGTPEGNGSSHGPDSSPSPE